MSATHHHSPACACNDVDARLDAAQQLVTERGGRFTSWRREVYHTLLRIDRPVTAYELLAILQPKQAKTLAPPTVYRALEFLQEHGLVHRLETTQVFFACDHPGQRHESVYLVCEACGNVQEWEDASVTELVTARAASAGFVARRTVVEVQGRCQACQHASA